MDPLRNSNAVVCLDTANCSPEAGRFLYLLAGVKGLRTEIYKDNPRKPPALRHRNNHIEDFWPMVMFLMDLRPWPPLLPNSVQQRGAMITFVNAVLNRGGPSPDLLNLYRNNKTPYLNGDLHPTLIDLAILAHFQMQPPESEADEAWVRRLLVAVDSYIERAATEKE